VWDFMPQLSGSEIKILLQLIRRTLQSGEAAPVISKAALMAATGLSHKEVAENVRSLAVKKLIVAMPQSQFSADARIGLAILNSSNRPINQNDDNGNNGKANQSIHPKLWMQLPAPEDFYVRPDHWQWLLWS